MRIRNILEIMHLKKVYPFAKAYSRRFLARSRLSVMHISLFCKRRDERAVTADIRHTPPACDAACKLRFRLQTEEPAMPRRRTGPATNPIGTIRRHRNAP